MSWTTIAGAAATAAVAVVVAATAGPATIASSPKDEDVEIKQSELDRLRAEAAKVGPLQDRLDALGREHRATLDQLHVANQRLGLEPFAPTTLRSADFVPKLGDATRLDARDGRGKHASLAKALGDTRRGMVIAFWATWCKPCTSPEELARLGRLRADLATQGADLVFMAIDGLDKVQADPRAGTWLYPLWQRDDGHIAMLPEAYVRSEGLDLPLILVVGKGGHVRWVRRGALDDDATRDLLTAVIRGE